MEIKIKNRLDSTELIKKINILKRQKKIGTEEWTRLNRVYKEYEESGEFDLSEEKIFKIKINELRRLITPERLILLETIKYNTFESITEIARKLNRDIKNVYDDLKIFENFGLIRFEGRRKKRIIVLIEKLSIII
ncbi:MAG: hypothetical protein GOV02_01450 [Candidatus Aenigmarchaeota archaeon]|nr:hypothetical protein [Candidatus Aenigmarchaeota archaeon]